MAIYLTILVGSNPRQATPVLATGDPVVIQAAVQALRQRLDPGCTTCPDHLTCTAGGTGDKEVGRGND